MTVEEGSFSLKLECALRELGFVEIGWRVIAHAGIFYVEPFTLSKGEDPLEELFGFQLHPSLQTEYSGLSYVNGRILPTAKKALDTALYLSPGAGE